jgi:hypothetical protein
MKLKTTMFGFLWGIATILVMAFPIGIFIGTCEIVRYAVYHVHQGVALLDEPATKELGYVFSFLRYPIVYGYLFLPIGAFLHMIIAYTTKIYSRWAWLAIFVGSVMLMCVYFPKGTISGGITLFLLFISGTFRKMRTRGREVEKKRLGEKRLGRLAAR